MSDSADNKQLIQRIPSSLVFPVEDEGMVDHSNDLAKDISSLLISSEMSDVTFIVEGRRFEAHRVVLAARCNYFHALLFGGMREATPNAEIELPDTSAEAFGILLEYVYSGKVLLSKLTEQTVLEVLAVAHRYGVVALEEASCTYLKNGLTTANVCLIFDMSMLFSLTGLQNSCGSFIDSNSTVVMTSPGFLALSKSGLQELLRRDSFYAKEVDIFRGVIAWCKANGEGQLSSSGCADVLELVRLQRLDREEMFSVVRPTKLVNPDRLLDAIEMQTRLRGLALNPRGKMVQDENILLMENGIEVLSGTRIKELFTQDPYYDLEHGYASHIIDESQADTVQSGLTIKLNDPYILNLIRLLLWDRDERYYCYKVLVALEEGDWTCVADHTSYPCRGWQEIQFEVTMVRYIRVVGTFNSANRCFHVVTMEAMHSSRLMDSKGGFLRPSENMATTKRCATVTEGVCRVGDALLNGNYSDYDWDSGYTCHQIGRGAIVVHLAQPMFVASSRFLLWDCDDRYYSYSVEVSVDSEHWNVVCDHSGKLCRSWQTVRFPLQLVSFIRIVGTHNTVNEVFHCVHFECPASPSTDAIAEASASKSGSTSS